MVRYACGPASGGTTPRRTPSSWPVGWTYVRCTSTCGVWAYESKKPGRSSTSSLKSISMRDTWVFKFRIEADFRLPHVSRSEPRDRGGDHHCRAAGSWPSPWPCRRAKLIGHRGRVLRGRIGPSGPCGSARRRIGRWDRDSVRGTRGALVRGMQMTYAGFSGR